MARRRGDAPRERITSRVRNQNRRRADVATRSDEPFQIPPELLDT